MNDRDICCHGDCNQGRDCPLRASHEEVAHSIDVAATFMLGVVSGAAIVVFFAMLWFTLTA